MRVVVILPWGQCLGGAEAMIQAVFDGAGEESHELEPVFLQDGPWPARLRAAGMRVSVIAAGRLRQAGRYARCVRELAELMRRRDPDLVLNWSAKTQLYGAPAAVLAGMRERVVWWQHSIPSPMTMPDALATLLPAKAIGCSSRAGALAQQRLWPRRRTFVVNAGAPAPRADAPDVEDLGLPAGVPVVGMVGRLQPWKGQDRLLRAVALLRERGLDVHTLIVGGDAYGLSREYAASLPRLAGKLGLEGAVTFTGQVEEADPYIRRMDVLVNASEPEPFGIVLLEGMARGVAVVAVDEGGPREIVADGVSGVLARSGSPRDLADALAPLLESAALRRRIGDAGRERFLSEFTDGAMRRRLFAELESLVGA